MYDETNKTLRAGSLFRNIVVLRNHEDRLYYALIVNNEDDQWEIYCTDVTILSIENNVASILSTGKEYHNLPIHKLDSNNNTYDEVILFLESIND